MEKNEGKKARLLVGKLVDFLFNSYIVCLLAAVLEKPMFSCCIL